jgi:hypothetical protein
MDGGEGMPLAPTSGAATTTTLVTTGMFLCAEVGWRERREGRGDGVGGDNAGGGNGVGDGDTAGEEAAAAVGDGGDGDRGGGDA